MYTSPIERTPSPGRHAYFSSGIASARPTDFFSRSSSDFRTSARNPVFAASGVEADAAGAAVPAGAALAFAGAACAAELMDNSAIVAQHSNILFIIVLL